VSSQADHDPEAPRWRRLPVDGGWHDIEVYPMLIDWSGKPWPRSARGIVSVKALDNDSFQHAQDAEGWIYVRYSYPYGWNTNDAHFSTCIAEAFAGLAGRRWWEDDRSRGALP
jgi:hypothetical protein